MKTYKDVVVHAYSELFDRMDLDNDGFLDKSELDQYMMRTEGAPVQETAFQWLLHKFEGKEGAFKLLLLCCCGGCCEIIRCCFLSSNLFFFSFFFVNL